MLERPKCCQIQCFCLNSFHLNLLFGRFERRHFSYLKSKVIIIIIAYKLLMHGFPFTCNQIYSGTLNVLFSLQSSFVFHSPLVKGMRNFRYNIWVWFSKFTNEKNWQRKINWPAQFHWASGAKVYLESRVIIFLLQSA